MKVNDLLRDEELLAAVPPNYDWPMLDRNAAASLCYTSGTTGSPRGVIYSHRSTVPHAFCTCASDCLALSARDTVLVVVPLFHANTWGVPYAQIPGTLDTSHRWTRDAMTIPNGTQVVEVDLDPETGRITLERLTAVDGYGVVVNPLVAAGQALGAGANAIAEAVDDKAIAIAAPNGPSTPCQIWQALSVA